MEEVSHSRLEDNAPDGSGRREKIPRLSFKEGLWGWVRSEGKNIPKG